MKLAGNSKRNHQGGFTLIELVIASTLIMIVMLGAYSTFHAVIRNWRGAEDSHAQIFGEAKAVKMLITRDIQSIPMTISNGMPDTKPYFFGTSNSFECITMVIPMNVQLESRRQLLKVEYRLRKSRDGAGMELLRSESPVVGPFPNWSPREGIDRQKLKLGRRREFVVARNVSLFELEYMWRPILQRKAKQLPGNTRPIKTDRVDNVLPKGIGIRLEFYDAQATQDREYTVFPFTVVIPGEVNSIPPELLYARGEGGTR